MRAGRTYLRILKRPSWCRRRQIYRRECLYSSRRCRLSWHSVRSVPK